MSDLVGLKKLLDQLDAVSDNAQDVLLKSMKKAAGFVRDDARLRVPFKTGDLRRRIHSRTTKTETGVQSVVSVSSEYGAYVEFGTGPRGEENHEGISPELSPHYSQTGWMIPVSAMSEKDAEDYGMVIAKKDGKVIGYYTKGMPARPFMYPALKDNEDQINKNIAKDLKKAIKEAAK